MLRLLIQLPQNQPISEQNNDAPADTPTSHLAGYYLGTINCRDKLIAIATQEEPQ